MSGYLVCEKHGESFTKACSSCVYDAGVKLAEVIHKDLEATKLQLHEVSVQRTKAVEMLAGFQAERDAANRLNDEFRKALEEIRYMQRDARSSHIAKEILKKHPSEKRKEGS